MNFATTKNAPAAVIEGSSHVFLTDAFRHQAAADIAAIRGFRYGTVVRPGPIRLEDLYHFIPIGPLIAKGTIKGKQLKNQIENSIDGSLNPDVSKWTGGWLFNFSGLRAEIDPYAKAGERAKSIMVTDRTDQRLEAARSGGRLHLCLLLLRARSRSHQHHAGARTSPSSRTRMVATSTPSRWSRAISRAFPIGQPRPRPVGCNCSQPLPAASFRKSRNPTVAGCTCTSTEQTAHGWRKPVE